MLFQRRLSFSKIPGGIQLFPGGGGVQLLIPTETYRICGYKGWA